MNATSSTTIEEGAENQSDPFVPAVTRKGRPVETCPPPTPAEVLALSRGLPFTKSVLGPIVEDATAAQRRFLHALFTQEQ